MKLSEILMGGDARMKAVMREVNAIYLENRWEFETTTVCKVDGVGKSVWTFWPVAPQIRPPSWTYNRNLRVTTSDSRAC